MLPLTLSNSVEMRKGKRLQRKHINFLVDALGFALFAFLIGTGFLLRYTLPPGSGGAAGQHGSEGTVKVLWGLTRHEWGDIHFWISVGLMSAMALHIVLHWRWIVCMVQGRPKEGSGMRVLAGVTGVAGLIFLAALPPLSQTDQISQNEFRSLRKGKENTAAPAANIHNGAADSHLKKSPENNQAEADNATSSSAQHISAPVEHERFQAIDGAVTLADIHRKYGVPADYVLGSLGLPAHPPEMRLGQLRKQYGFTIAEVRAAVAAYGAVQND